MFHLLFTTLYLFQKPLNLSRLIPCKTRTVFIRLAKLRIRETERPLFLRAPWVYFHRTGFTRKFKNKSLREMNIFSQIENFLHPPEKCAEGSEGSAKAAKAATGHDRFLPRCERKMLFILCCWGKRLYFLHHVNFSGLPKKIHQLTNGFSKSPQILFPC